jgi:hypothetical protein
MLTALLHRARQAMRRAYLRHRIRNAELDAQVIQAESLSAPMRLVHLRSYITDLSNQLAELEASHERRPC